MEILHPVMNIMEKIWERKLLIGIIRLPPSIGGQIRGQITDQCLVY